MHIWSKGSWQIQLWIFFGKFQYRYRLTHKFKYRDRLKFWYRPISNINHTSGHPTFYRYSKYLSLNILLNTSLNWHFIEDMNLIIDINKRITFGYLVQYIYSVTLLKHFWCACLFSKGQMIAGAIFFAVEKKKLL